MLFRLDELREIGRFSLLRHKAPQFAKLTLIFARNGYGKSTISAVLRSAFEGRPEYISARRRLDAQQPCAVKCTWSTGAIQFVSGRWNGPSPKTLIFDQEFVQRNVHLGDTVTRENRRSLLPVVLGEEGVNLAQKINDLDQAQRDITAALKEQASHIKATHPSIEDVKRYCSVPIPADIDTRVAAAARSEELAKQTVAVRDKRSLPRIPIPPLQELEALATATIETLGRDVASRVRGHIEEHRLGSQGDRWLKFGIEHHHYDRCPFCDQSTQDLPLIEAYTTYYSEAFAVLIARRDAIIGSIQKLINGGESDWRVISGSNQEDWGFWSTVSEIGEPASLSEEQRRVVERGLRALDQAFSQKITDPLAVVSLQEGAISELIGIIDAYNASVDQANLIIESAKQAARFSDLRTAQTQHLKLLALKAKQTEPMAGLAANYLQDDRRREQIGQQKAAAQSELSTYAPATIAARQATINSLLANFGADFQIVDVKANFVGREPNTDFAIAIGGGKVAAGARSDTEPTFKTVLSAGDKTTLALAFFLAQVRSDASLKDSVVVLDDPFNSQDMQRQFETTSQIRTLAAQAAQVIVMSHDPRFIQMIERDWRGPVITLQIQCSAAGDGAVSPWSSSDELKTSYVRNSEIIREYAGHGTLLNGVTEVTVLQAVRPFLEDYIRARFPGRFGDLVMLDEMTTSIEQVGASDPLFVHVADLRALNEFTRPSMHGGAQTPDPVALRTQCRRVVALVGAY